MDREFPGLSRKLNVAVLHIASRLFPTGFDVSGYAANNYADLCAYVETHGRYCVWGGGSEHTAVIVFGAVEVNTRYMVIVKSIMLSVPGMIIPTLPKALTFRRRVSAK